MIGILNYGSGNIKSLSNALSEINIKHKIVTNYKNLKHNSKLIIPGVGAYSHAMKKIIKAKFFSEIKEFAIKKPILGICVGMQILSEFGREIEYCEGLKIVKGSVNKINEKENISHVGWNSVSIIKKNILFKNISNGCDFYFVHSYCFNLENHKEETSYVKFDDKKIVSSVEKNNIFGVQFHPEKSHKNGLKVLLNFSNL